MNDELTPDERAAMRARIVGGARDISPAGAHRNAWIAGSVAAVLVVAIAGGVVATSTLSAPPIANTPTPTVTLPPIPEPTPTPTPTVGEQRTVTQPVSRFAFGCDDVAPRVAEFFDGEVPDVASTIPRSRGNAWTQGPLQYSFAQAGALYCEFGDIGGTWVTVAMIPDAQGAIEDRESVVGPDCGASLPCESIDGTYLLVDAGTAPTDNGSSGDPVKIEAAYQALRGDILASPPSAAQWEPPTGTTLLTGECSGILSAERFGEAVGIADMSIRHEGGGWSIESWMLSGYWDAPFCSYVGPGDDPWTDGTGALMMWLPGGEWAYDQADLGDAVPATGGRATDMVRLTTVDVGELTSFDADVLVDGNWMRVRLPESVAEADRPAAAARVAEALFERAYG
ncbi:MAG: hypothetical protein PIR02_20085 [Microbacterium enclense]